MTAVTFLAKDVVTDEYASDVVVTVYRSNGEIVLRDEFHLGILVPTEKFVLLNPGDYSIWLRADGYKGVWNHPVTIPDQEEDLVIEIPVETTVQAGLLPGVLVFGWSKGATPDPTIGRAVPSHLATRYHGMYTFSTQTDSRITFKEIKDSAKVDLLETTTFDTGLDRNGYFEVFVNPDTWYQVSFPGKSPIKVKIPSTGPVDLRTLLVRSTRDFLYNLR